MADAYLNGKAKLYLSSSKSQNSHEPVRLTPRQKPLSERYGIMGIDISQLQYAPIQSPIIGSPDQALGICLVVTNIASMDLPWEADHFQPLWCGQTKRSMQPNRGQKNVATKPGL